MLKIRLKRNRRKKQPSYRLVVMPASYRRNGRAIDELGYYNVITKQLKIDSVKITKWLEKGAKPTETVNHLLIKSKILES